jgi:hypothetical protein
MIMATADHIHAEAKQQHYAGFVAEGLSLSFRAYQIW